MHLLRAGGITVTIDQPTEWSIDYFSLDPEEEDKCAIPRPMKVDQHADGDSAKFTLSFLLSRIGVEHDGRLAGGAFQWLHENY